MQLLSDFAVAILQRPPSEMVTYKDAFLRHAKVDPFTATNVSLADVCRSKIEIANQFAGEQPRDFWLDLILTHLVEPKIGFAAPCIIYDWPASQSALSIVRKGSPDVAERFELYVDGVELANGYHELLDPDELLRRNEAINQQRVADGKSALPVESRLVEAMRAGLPACAGVAVGVDRLLMVISGAESISDVMAFGFEES